MKDLLYYLPRLSARQWASLQMYIEAPVDEAERARLVEDLRDAIRSPEHRDLALKTLDEMLWADGEVTQEEERVVAEIKSAVESVDIGLLSRLVKGMTTRRAQAVADAPNREDYFEDFVKNKVYYGIRRRLDLGEAELNVGEDVLRTLSLAGGAGHRRTLVISFTGARCAARLLPFLGTGRMTAWTSLGLSGKSVLTGRTG